jgi:hypothetical protein
LVLGPALGGFVGSDNARFANPGKCKTDRQQYRGQDQKELGCRGRPTKSLRNRHDAHVGATAALVKFTQQTEKIVWYGFAQRIVVNGSKGSTKVAGALLAPAAV